MKIVKVKLDKIEQNENSRVIYKAGELGDLMQSMKRDGLLQAVGVKALGGGRFEAVFGNRRIMAAKKLGWSDIDAHVVEAETDNDRDILNLVENLKRQNTTVAEDGRIFVALRERGLSTEEIAARVGISKERVQLGIDVLSVVPDEFKKKIVHRSPGQAKPKGKISATAAHTILDLRKTHRLNRRQTRALLNYASTENASTDHIAHVAPLLRDGFTVGEAIKAVDRLTRVTLFVYIDEANIKKLEKNSGKSITAVLWEQLEKNKDLGIQRFAKHKYYRSAQQHRETIAKASR